MHLLFEPGWFSSPEVRAALVVGALVAAVSGVIGVFAVLRGQSFAGHALTEAAATGGAGFSLAGLNPLAGFVLGAVAAAGATEAIGDRHARARDLATGVVLGVAIGLASLFLYLATTGTSGTASPQQILFGSLFVTGATVLPASLALGASCLAILAVVWRPLLVTSVSTEIAAARGVRVRAVGLAYVLTLALAVGLASLAVGAILSTALLVGPAAAAIRLTRRMGPAVACSGALGVACSTIGILIAYDSADWLGGNGLPVSFCVVGAVFCAYLLTALAEALINAAGAARARWAPAGPARG